MKHNEGAAPVEAATTVAPRPMTKAERKRAARAAKEAEAAAKFSVEGAGIEVEVVGREELEAPVETAAVEAELEPVAAEEVAPVAKPKKARAKKAAEPKREIVRLITRGDPTGWKRDLHIGQRELMEALAIFEEREGRLPTESELLNETVTLFGPATAPRRSKVHAETPREYFRGYLAMGLTLGNFVIAA